MSAFSLVELLVVIAIIGMMVGLSALAVSGMRAPALQHAADQVMSGFSLARQIAITKNTRAAFLVATNTNAGSGLPAEPFRYWSVVYSNKGANNWSFAKDWEALPNGAIFWEILPNSAAGPRNNYNTLNTNPFQTNKPSFAYSNYTIVSGNSTIINNGSFADTEFKSSGTVLGGVVVAIRICEGAVLNGNATLTSTNRYYFIESNSRTGRIRMRAPESYTKD
jgi:prepilin-type N-terminal cleavage/methylation domain-containing protein